MPIYPIINKKTGETKNIKVSVDEIMAWYKANPDWTRNWAEGCASMAEVGEWKDKLAKSKPSWNEMLDRFSKVPGSTVKKI